MDDAHCATTAGDAAGGSSSFMPHGHCYLWEPGLVWLHVVSDLLITVAYYSIPLILFAFVSRRRDVPFNGMFILFGLFIFACGTTHFMEVVTVWRPAYWLSGTLKAVTAAVSLTAAIMLVPIIPKALALPSLRAANEQLQRTADELRRSNQELEQFAYVSSHDLQEPLRMVSMYLDLLTRRLPDLDERSRQYVVFAQEGAGRMRSLIDGLLEYSRIGRAAPAEGVADANQALSDALANLEPAIAATGTHVTRGELPRVRADRGQLGQVLQNLVSNAIKYGTTDQPWVHVSARRDGGVIEFSVQDNGIGIEVQYHQRIFEVFQRLHERTRYGGGTGIGLAICKKIVERHGGRIWVESQPGTGSVFRFTLPAAD